MKTSTVESVIALKPAFLVKLESVRGRFLGTFQSLGSLKNYVTQNFGTLAYCNSLIHTCMCVYQRVKVYQRSNVLL